MLRTASSLPLTGLLTLGSDPARFQTEPPACYRASSLDHLADGDWIDAGNKPVAASAALGNYCVASDWYRWCTRGTAGHRHGFHDPLLRSTASSAGPAAARGALDRLQGHRAVKRRTVS